MNNADRVEGPRPTGDAHVPLVGPRKVQISECSMEDVAASTRAYQLSTVLCAHSDDVKCVYPIDSDCILSASRDRTVGVWKRKQESKDFELTRLLAGHDGYVNSLEFIPADEDCESDLIASSGNSAIILFHLYGDDLGPDPSPEPVDGLIGHHANVCALQYSRKHKKMISASWDCAGRLWSRSKSSSNNVAAGKAKSKAGDWACELVLSGHEAAVWGVAILDEGLYDGNYLTGSADRTLRMYDPAGTAIRTFDIFPDAIRSLATFPNFHSIALALNDGTVRLVQLEDGATETLKSHTDYVYHVSVRSENVIISCGEDHTAAYWNGESTKEKYLQRLIHPCQSVWCCSFLPNGDIVSAGSDNAIRVWTASSDRVADRETLQVYEKETANIDSKGQGSLAEGNEETVLDIVLNDEKAPLQLRFSQDTDPEELVTTFAVEHQLTAEEKEQIESFIRRAQGY